MPDQVITIVGLSTAEARSRLTEVGPNAVVTQHRVRLMRRIGNQLRDPMILLLLAAVILTLGIGGAPRARVIRDGRQQEIAAADVVPGDALVLPPRPTRDLGESPSSGRPRAITQVRPWNPCIHSPAWAARPGRPSCRTEE